MVKWFLFILAVVLLIGLIGLWIAAGIKEAVTLRRRKRGAQKPVLSFWKVTIGICVWFEKKIWWLTGIRLPMYRRRAIRKARYLQHLLNKEHDTSIVYPIDTPALS